MTPPLPHPIVTVKGLSGIKTRLKLRIQRLENLREPLEKIAQDYYSMEREWFASKGGGRWVPLSKNYAEWKRKTHPGKPIMRLTDRMWGEFTGKPGHYRIDRFRLQVRIINADYWTLHSKGSAAKHIPKRPLVSPLFQGRKIVWRNLITRWLAARLDVTPDSLLRLRK